jgi:hypothetical protein
MWTQREGKQNLHGHERRRVERSSLKCTPGNDYQIGSSRAHKNSAYDALARVGCNRVCQKRNYST